MELRKRVRQNETLCECEGLYREKLMTIRRLVDKLIVCVPQFEAPKLKAFDVDVWPYPKVRKPRRIVINEETYEELGKVAKDMGIEMERPRIFDEAIKRLLNS